MYVLADGAGQARGKRLGCCAKHAALGTPGDRGRSAGWEEIAHGARGSDDFLEPPALDPSYRLADGNWRRGSG